MLQVAEVIWLPVCIEQFDDVTVRLKIQPALSAEPTAVHVQGTVGSILQALQLYVRLVQEVSLEHGNAGEADDREGQRHQGEQRGDQLDAQRGTLRQSRHRFQRVPEHAFRASPRSGPSHNSQVPTRTAA